MGQSKVGPREVRRMGHQTWIYLALLMFCVCPSYQNDYPEAEESVNDANEDVFGPYFGYQQYLKESNDDILDKRALPYILHKRMPYILHKRMPYIVHKRMMSEEMGKDEIARILQRNSPKSLRMI